MNTTCNIHHISIKETTILTSFPSQKNIWEQILKGAFILKEYNLFLEGGKIILTELSSMKVYQPPLIIVHYRQTLQM